MALKFLVQKFCMKNPRLKCWWNWRQDKDHKYEFLGRAKIPLLRIRNDERRWVKLKDKKLRGPAKGDNPQILVECFFVYNKVKIP